MQNFKPSVLKNVKTIYFSHNFDDPPILSIEKATFLDAGTKELRFPQFLSNEN